MGVRNHLIEFGALRAQTMTCQKEGDFAPYDSGDQSKWIIPKSERQTAPLTDSEVQKLLTQLGNKPTPKPQVSPMTGEDCFWLFASCMLLVLLAACILFAYKAYQAYLLQRAKYAEYEKKRLEMVRIFQVMSQSRSTRPNLRIADQVL